MSFKIGNSVKVKPGVKDPDLEADISGWQGRISAVQDDGIVCIDWDSITLKQMPGSVIKKCEQASVASVARMKRSLRSAIRVPLMNPGCRPKACIRATTTGILLRIIGDKPRLFDATSLFPLTGV